MSFTPGAGTRFVVTSASSQASGTALTGPLSITGGTATANTPALSATQTWNNAAVTFTGWQLNVTDTASNASSLLMDLQVGGASRFSVDKAGTAAIAGNAAIAGGITVGNSQGVYATSGSVRFGVGATSYLYVASNQIRVANFGITFSSSADINNPNFSLLYDAANALAQRNGVNAQTLRVYNTFTDASNYERLVFNWVGNIAYIATERAGTGSARNISIDSSGGAINFSSSSSVQLQVNGRAFASHAVGASTLNFGGVTAGPANIDTIVVFTNNSQRWTFNNSGHFVAFADNTYDIGATGANRPRNVFWAGYQEMSEMTAPAAPAANSVRIYAEDNGSGKTRLMARFATGAAQQIAIEP